MSLKVREEGQSHKTASWGLSEEAEGRGHGILAPKVCGPFTCSFVLGDICSFPCHLCICSSFRGRAPSKWVLETH